MRRCKKQNECVDYPDWCDLKECPLGYEPESSWTKEAPTEYGFYPALKQPQNGPPKEWEVVLVDSDLVVHMFFDPNWYVTDDFAEWGPRVEFPDAPED